MGLFSKKPKPYDFQIMIPELLFEVIRFRSTLPRGYWYRRFISEAKGLVEVYLGAGIWFDQRMVIDELKIGKYLTKIRKEKILPPRIFHAHFDEATILLPSLGINFCDPKKFAQNTKVLKVQIDLISRFEHSKNTPVILIFHTNEIPRGMSLAKARGNVVKVLKETVSYAKKRGIILSIETPCIIGDRPRVGFYFEDLVKITDAIGEENFGITADLGHLLVVHQGDYRKVKKIITTYPDYINYAHVHHPNLNLKKVERGRNPIGIRWIDHQLTLDAHTAIHNLRNEKEFYDLIGFLVEKTGVKKARALTLELSWRWVWPTFWNHGTSMRKVVKSYDKLDKFLDKKLKEVYAGTS